MAWRAKRPRKRQLQRKASRTNGVADFILVGRVGAPHGVRGWVNVTSYTENPSDLTRYPQLHLGEPGAYRPLGKVRFQDRSQPGRSRLLAAFPDINDRDQAATLRGQELALPVSALPPAEAGSFYWRDLEGLRALAPDGAALGIVHAVIDTPAHAVLAVRCPPALGARLALSEPYEVLVPFVSEFTGAVDLAAGTIELTWPEVFEPES